MCRRRHILLAITCLLGFATASQGQTVPTRLATPKEIQDILAERIDKQHKSDGIVVGVISNRGREIIGYGKFDKKDPRPVDGETVFEIGSISKVFTSLLLSDMVLKGEVSLSDPVAKYLPPSVHVPSRNGKQITLLDLSTHHSGLPRDPNNHGRGDYTPEQLYDFLNGYTLTRDPGEKYEYSNLAAGLLSYVLSLKAGTSYADLLRTRITAPLHLDHTSTVLTPAMQANLTPGHYANFGIATPISTDVLQGAGAIRSTADDLLIFLAANMGLIKTPLEPAMKNMLSVRRSIGDPNIEIALAWLVFLGPNEMIGHGGQTTGYQTFIGFEPRRKVGIVLLSNSAERIDDLARPILDHPLTGPVEQRIGPTNLPRGSQP